MANKNTLERSSGSLFGNSWEPTAPERNFGSTGSDDLVSKRLSVWAISSVALGVFSILAFVKVGFIAISIVGILFGIFAFSSINAAGGELSGKKLASLGLALCLATAIGGPVRAYTYRTVFEKQADQFCHFWFEQLQAGEIEMARTMADPYWSRPPMISHDDKVGYWLRAKGNDSADERHHNVHVYLSNTTLLTLVSLGDRAKFSLYEVIGTSMTARGEKTALCYAVTVKPKKEGEKPQTFFLRLAVERTRSKSEEGEKRVGLNLASVEPSPLPLLPNGRPNYD